MKINQYKLEVVVLILLAIALCNKFNRTNAQAARLVSAMVLFGDSIIDVGNNNLLPTLFKADYLPYGRDFVDPAPTGRFCNGKLAIDIIAELVGFNNSYPAPYLSPDLSNTQLANGVNFASAASGYDNHTAIFNHAISLPQQLEYYKEYQGRLASAVGMETARSIRNDTLFITLFGLGKPECVAQKNTDSREFNVKMNETITRLKSRLPGLKMEFFDIYTPLHDLVQNPSDNGFVEARRGCCGTGTIETTSILCNSKSIGTCTNASQYVFWDSVHPTETTNRYIANTLQIQGMNLIFN